LRLSRPCSSAPGALDQFQRLRQRPAGHQRLGPNDEDHRDDQGYAHGHREERGQVPGLGRVQVPAQDHGGGEAGQPSYQRPHGTDRPAEQLPRYPRQHGHQHDAGGQDGHREHDPVHRG
jgi:hypothetical protein